MKFDKLLYVASTKMGTLSSSVYALCELGFVSVSSWITIGVPSRGYSSSMESWHPCYEIYLRETALTRQIMAGKGKPLNSDYNPFYFGPSHSRPLYVSLCRACWILRRFRSRSMTVNGLSNRVNCEIRITSNCSLVKQLVARMHKPYIVR